MTTEIASAYNSVFSKLTSVPYYFEGDDIKQGESGKNTPSADLRYWAINGNFVWVVYGETREGARQIITNTEHLNESCIQS